MPAKKEASEQRQEVSVFDEPYNMFGSMDRNKLPEIEPRRKRQVDNDQSTGNDTHRKYRAPGR